MSTHYYRHQEHETSERRAIRAWCPNGRNGFSVEDLDVSLRLFKPFVDGIGTFRLIECKRGDNSLGYSKEVHFCMYDTLLRIGDPESRFYKGYFLVQTKCDWPECDEFYVNKVCLSQMQFRRWLWMDMVDYWVERSAMASDPQEKEAVRLACELKEFDLISIPSYVFPTSTAAKIRTLSKVSVAAR